MPKIIILLLISMSLSYGQIVKANVSVTAAKFNGSQKDEIKNLANVVKDYINNKNWVYSDISDQIDIEISIIIESVFKSNGQRAYKGQFLINSPAQENYYDKKLNFFYKKNESISSSGVEYQTLGNVIDFYMYMVLAGELDTYDEYGGDKYYVMAQETISLGLRNMFSSTWSYREKIYNENISSFVKSIRLAKYKYYVALNFKENKDYKNMRLEAHKLIDDVVFAYENQPNNLMLKRFLEGYSKRITSILDPEFDQAYFKKMIVVDPVRKKYYSTFLKD